MTAKRLSLNDLAEDQIDAVLLMSEQEKTIFFNSLIEQYFPHIEKHTNEYSSLQIHYRSCWLMEKIYRNNTFMKECFSIVYTKTGLIRNIWNDLYYTDDDLIIH